jgi:Holliday junction resolvasome RuvABC endonuclease subunit
LKNSIRYVLGIDPSGNFIEGKGTTGWCVFDTKRNRIAHIGSIQASQSKSQEAYWHANIEMIKTMVDRYRMEGIVLSVEDYVLYAGKARSQINSAMETSQLIGIIKMLCFYKGIPLYMRTASQVMRRWTDTILEHKSYIYKVGGSWYTECRQHVLCEHERDAMRHAIHCAYFELGKD